MEESLTETIDAEMVGLAPGTALPFRFVPAAHMSPIVMSFPHVGLAWPSQLGHQPAVDFPRNADFEVHTLFRGIEAWGVATVRATVSRLVVDLNRAEDDVSDILVPDHPAPRPRRRPGSPSSSDPRDHADHADHADQANQANQADQADQADHGHRWDRPGRGVVWASAIGSYGRTTPMLREPLRYVDFAERIAAYHRPYHRALEILLERRHRRFGYAVLIDGHSMPGSVNVDLVVGTLDGQTCSPLLRQFALHTLAGEPSQASALLSVRADDPYRGGEIIRKFGRPDLGYHAFQLEVNRRLYMDEHRHTVWPWPEDAAVEVSRVPFLQAPRSARPRARQALPEDRRKRELGELLRRVRGLVHHLVEDAPTLELRPDGPSPYRQVAE